MMKKMLSLCLALMLVFSLSSAALAELSPVGTYPLTSERETLTILMQQDVLVEDYDTNAFTLWIEETCNVDLQFELLPAGSEGTDKLNLMLSSTMELPDIVNMGMTNLQDYVYGSAGIFLDLNEYYENSAYYINKRMEEWPEVDLLAPVTCADGKIYCIPQYYNETIGISERRLWMNMEWLEKLGLEVPTTTEELYSVLKAFKEQDPNGNGIADEIPLLPQDMRNLMGYLMNAFIYTDTQNNYYTVKDGQVGVAYTEEAFKEGVAFMRKLCEEGLLSPLTFSQTSQQYKQTVTGDNALATVGSFIAFSTSVSINGYAASPLTPQYAAIAPVAGPEGVRWAEYSPAYSQPFWHITSYCENPELAFRVGDLLMSEEAFLRNRIGEPGKHWEYAEPGLPCYFPNMDAKFTFKSIWNETQNSMWRNNSPGFCQDDLDRRYFEVSSNPVNATYTCAVICPDYLACVPAVDEYVPSLIFTPDETEEISEIKAVLTTYVNEYLARFITGDLSLENDWDTFQDELMGMGLENFLELSQNAYDRMSK